MAKTGIRMWGEGKEEKGEGFIKFSLEKRGRELLNHTPGRAVAADWGEFLHIGKRGRGGEEEDRQTTLPERKRKRKKGCQTFLGNSYFHEEGKKEGGEKGKHVLQIYGGGRGEAEDGLLVWNQQKEYRIGLAIGPRKEKEGGSEGKKETQSH